eukprot:776915-Amphidinium_carterae.2
MNVRESIELTDSNICLVHLSHKKRWGESPPMTAQGMFDLRASTRRALGRGLACADLPLLS